MAERRNYIALDWVTGEIEETLQQARQSLEDYVADREDVTKLRFCLTYAHQVHGSLKMVELDGAALLAAEIEQLALALVNEKVADVTIALEALMAGFLHLSAYVHRLSTTRQDQPAKLLPTLNELRAARGEGELSEAAVFNPDVGVGEKSQITKPTIHRDEFNELIRKLRQYYQAAMVGVIRDQEIDKNYELLLKVCNRLHKVSHNTASENLWKISHAVMESLAARAEPASHGIKTVLRQVDNEIKKLQDDGRDALEQRAESALLKSLLYTVARAEPTTELIAEIQQIYRLKEALPSLDQADERNIALPDSGAVRSVVEALNEELSGIQDVLDMYARGDHGPEYDIKALEPAFQRIINTLSVLGAVDALKIIRAQQQRIMQAVAARSDLTVDQLEDIAAQIISVQDALARSKTIADTQHIDLVRGQLDQAHESVIREARNSLEQIKEAIIEFVASQWDVEPLLSVPGILEAICGGLSMVPLKDAAQVLNSCSRYVQDKLLKNSGTPDWQMLDTLADAITSIEFYLECLLGDANAELDSILTVAIESVTALGYPVAGVSVVSKHHTPVDEADTHLDSSFVAHDASTGEELRSLSGANVIDLQARQQRKIEREETPADEQEPKNVAFSIDADDEDIIDEEVIEIFVEEAAEVLETIESYLPQWLENSGDKEALTEIRRAFHTLKGSGRMVGAADVGELAWSIENMLNRLIEGARPVKDANQRVVQQALQVIPPMVEAFEKHNDIDLGNAQELMEQVNALAAGEPRTAKGSDQTADAAEQSELPLDQLPQEEVSAELDLVSLDTEETRSAVSVEEDEDLIDDEVIGIFVEEAAEVLETINEYLPRWLADAANAEALTEIRRAFHTLKGSGRMVGAVDVGELAWSIENMLNRIIDGTCSANGPHQQLVQQVVELVPGMVEAFEARRAIDLTAANQLSAWAHQLASGEQIDMTGLSSGSAQEAAADSSKSQLETTDTVVFDEAVDEELVEEGIDDDTTLLDIFSGEAVSHANVLRMFVTEARDGGEPVMPSEELQRALHTLKGSAHMAEIGPIAEVITPLERFIKELRGCQLKADEEVVDLLEKAITFIEQGLAQLYTSPQTSLPGSQEYLQQIADIQQNRLAAFVEQVDHTETESVGVTTQLAEAMEKLLHASDLVTTWMNHRETPDALTQLLDDLNIVQDIANHAGDTAIASLAEYLSGLYGTVIERQPSISDEFFDVIQRGHDCLVDMMDVIAAGQTAQIDKTLLEEIDQLRQQLSVEQPISQPKDVLVEDSFAEESLDLQYSEPDASEAEAEAENWIAALTEAMVDVDEETLEIFLEEASDLMDGLDHALDAWLNDPSDAEPVEELKRILHTLKGGARLSGIMPLGDLSHAYETYLDDAKGTSSTFFEKVQKYQDQLRAMLDFVLSGAGATPCAADTQERFEEEIAATGTLDDSGDEEVLEIFLEEAKDLQEAIDESIHAWMDDREDLSQLDELKRHLHTLKGGARLAGITALGNLSHNFETFLITSEQRNQITEQAFFDSMQTYQDQLSATMEEMVADLRKPKEIARVDQTGVGQATTVRATTANANASAGQTRHQVRGEASTEHARAANNVVPLRSVSLTPITPKVDVPPAAIEATRQFVENFEKGLIKNRGPQEVVKVSAQLLEDLVNLAGETSISRGRVEEQISEMGHAIEEMDATIERIKGQLRRLEIETEAQILFRQEQVESVGIETFDPLEMDRYSHLQQLAKSLVESASDIQEVKETFSDKIRDLETLLLQQSRINTELQEGLMRSQMVPFSRMVPRLRRIVRQVSGELGKQVDLHLENVEGELDRTVLERMVAPLEHMLRNAVDHGIESIEERRSKGKSTEGVISLGLSREGGEVVLRLRDDGAGIDLEAVRAKATERGLIDAGTDLSNHEILQFILHAGFSTAKKVTQISGRGVGMDVVHSEIKQLGGSMDIQSLKGHGTTFTVRLPFTVSVNRALMVCIGSDTYAIPLNTIEGIVRVSPYELEAYYQPDAPAFEYAGQSYRLRYMGSLLRNGENPKLDGQSMPLPVVLVRGGEHSIAVQVDRLLGSREVVVKTLGPQFSMVDGLSGATVLGDGSVVVILDLMAMIRADMSRILRETDALEAAAYESAANRNTVVMVVDDSVTVRKVTSRFLERQGMDVVLAKDGVDAMAKLQELEVLPDVMLLDIEMPRMDGFEVASRVRHSERLQQIPIIMITSRTGEKHRERALSLGVNKYMGKPYQEVELLETISELTGKEIM